MSKRVLVATAATLSLTVASATGCGGDDDEDPAVADANAICERIDQDLTTALEDLGPNPSTKEVTAVISDGFVPTVNEGMKDIAALDVPADLREDISRMVEATNEATDDIAKDPAGYLRDIQAGSENPYAEAAAIAHDAGLDACFPNV